MLLRRGANARGASRGLEGVFAADIAGAAQVGLAFGHTQVADFFYVDAEHFARQNQLLDELLGP